MAEFVYFVEGGGGHDRLAELGLADRFADTPRISSLPARGAGPEGRVGIAFHAAPRLPEGLSWQGEVECGKSEVGRGMSEARTSAIPHPTSDIPAPRYWVGWRPEEPPGPAELARAISLRGAFVRLGDGRQWLIPLVAGHEGRPDAERCGLPRRPTWEGGGLAWRVRSELAPLVEQAADVLERLTNWPARAAECWDYGAALLAAGYRLGATEVLALGLLDEDSLAAVLAVALDMYTRVAATAGEKVIK